MTHLRTVLLVLAATAVAAAATSATARAQSAADLVASWPAAERSAVMLIIDSATSGRLPVAALRAKIAEGIAKNAEPSVITAVLRTLHTNLRDARDVLGAAAGDGELVAGAAALQSGANTGELQALRRSVRDGRAVTQVLVVFTDLARRGVAPADGVEALSRLARAGAGDAAFAQLRIDVAKDVAAGAPPRAAMTKYADNYLARGFTPSGGIFPPRRLDEH